MLKHLMSVIYHYKSLSIVALWAFFTIGCANTIQPIETETVATNTETLAQTLPQATVPQTAVPQTTISETTSLPTELPYSDGKTYLFFAIDSDDYIKEIRFKGERSLTFYPTYSSDIANQHIVFILAEASPGDYEFSQVNTGIKENTLDDEIDWSFELIEGKVNYLGHLEVNQEIVGGYWGYSSFELANKSSFAIEYLQDNYPALFNQKSLVYQGPGTDDFIRYYLANYTVKAVAASQKSQLSKDDKVKEIIDEAP